MSQLSQLSQNPCYLALLPLVICFIYKVFEGCGEFACHSYGVFDDAEVAAYSHGSEVWAQAAVVASGDGDVLPYVDVGVALGWGWGAGFDEGVVAVVVVPLCAFRVAVEDAVVVLAWLGQSVVAQAGLEVYVQQGVDFHSAAPFSALCSWCAL